tara:strand:+ start:651 stop:860 length:210 start_codon:yes stop_codon:yes gene_type:complete
MSEDWIPQDPRAVNDAIGSLMDTVLCIKQDLGCPDQYAAQLLRRIADDLDKDLGDNCKYEDDPKLDFYA